MARLIRNSLTQMLVHFSSTRTVEADTYEMIMGRGFTAKVGPRFPVHPFTPEQTKALRRIAARRYAAYLKGEISRRQFERFVHRVVFDLLMPNYGDGIRVKGATEHDFNGDEYEVLRGNFREVLADIPEHVYDEIVCPSDCPDTDPDFWRVSDIVDWHVKNGAVHSSEIPYPYTGCHRGSWGRGRRIRGWFGQHEAGERWAPARY